MVMRVRIAIDRNKSAKMPKTTKQCSVTKERETETETEKGEETNGWVL